MIVVGVFIGGSFVNEGYTRLTCSKCGRVNEVKRDSFSESLRCCCGEVLVNIFGK